MWLLQWSKEKNADKTRQFDWRNIHENPWAEERNKTTWNNLEEREQNMETMNKYISCCCILNLYKLVYKWLHYGWVFANIPITDIVCSFTLCIETKLSTDYLSIKIVPVIITDCTPDIVVAKLNTPTTWVTSCKSDISLGASCCSITPDT